MATKLEPAVAAWEASADRQWWWHKHNLHDASVPIKALPPETVIPPLDETKPLGVLTDGHGHRVTVFGEIQPAGKSAHRTPVVDLTFIGLRGTGKYEGEIDLMPSDEKLGTMKLTLIQRDRWPVPVATLLLGLLVAWLIQRFAGVNANLRRLQSSADESKRRLDARANIQGVSISDADVAWNSAKRAIRRLRWFTIVSIDKEGEDFKCAKLAVDQLALAAKNWQSERLGNALETLRAALHDVAQNPWPQPPGSDSLQPALLRKGWLLLSEPTKVADVPARFSDATAMAELATRWSALQDRLVELAALLARLNDVLTDESERRLLGRARRLHSGVRWDLWHTTDPTDLKRRTTLDEVNQLDDIIGQLSYRIAEPEWAAVDVPELAGRGWLTDSRSPDRGLMADSASGLGADLGDIFDKVVEAVRSPEAEEVRIRLIGVAIAAIAVFVAAWGALVLLYFDKPFGTARDYLGLLVWGLGTAAALETMNALLTKLVTPLPSAAATPAKTATPESVAA